MERVEGIIDRARRVQDGFRVNAAVADSQRLTDEQREVQEQMRADPQAGPFTQDDALAIAQRILSQVAGKEEVPYGP